MNKYIETKISIKDKLILLFFDLIPERYINKPIQNQVIYKDNIKSKKETYKVNDINTKEDELSFFDNIDDGKSNF